jgi:hypothetical protein
MQKKIKENEKEIVLKFADPELADELVRTHKRKGQYRRDVRAIDFWCSTTTSRGAARYTNEHELAGDRQKGFVPTSSLRIGAETGERWRKLTQALLFGTLVGLVDGKGECGKDFHALHHLCQLHCARDQPHRRHQYAPPRHFTFFKTNLN